MIDIFSLSVEELATKIKDAQITSVDVCNKYIERLGDLQKKITRISGENWLTLNGRAIKLDNISFEIPS